MITTLICAVLLAGPTSPPEVTPSPAGRVVWRVESGAFRSAEGITVEMETGGVYLPKASAEDLASDVERLRAENASLRGTVVPVWLTVSLVAAGVLGGVVVGVAVRPK